MGKTKIEWSERSWNPIVGCSKVSEGCRSCYAIPMARRIVAMGGAKGAYDGTVTMDGAPNWTGVLRLIEDRLGQPKQWRKPGRIFVNSMSDLFHESLSDEQILRVFQVMLHDAPHHIYQVLTKRPERMAQFLRGHCGLGLPEKIPGHIWLGASIEDQKSAGLRLPHLRTCKRYAEVIWVSAEPLLDSTSLAEGLGVMPVTTLALSGHTGGPVGGPSVHWEKNGGECVISWVVVGGESGAGARGMHHEWAQDIRDQCVAAGVPFFFKQWGEWKPSQQIPEWSGRGSEETPRELRSKRDGWVHPGGDVRKVNGLCVAHVIRLGKGKAGRELDGRTWDEYPEVGRVRT